MRISMIDEKIILAELRRLRTELVEGENTMFEQGRISAFEDIILMLRDPQSYIVNTQIKSQNEVLKRLNSALNSMEHGGHLPLDEDKMISNEEIDACNIQYASIDGAIKAHAEDYSFNIESELFQQLTPEQQKMWRKEIEQAVLSGAYSGLNLARDESYEENRQEESVSEELEDEIDAWCRKVITGLPIVKEAARHFANWQKQQMVKAAIETEVVDDSFGQQVGEVLAIRYDVQPEDNLEIGDKVKLIIIKEE